MIKSNILYIWLKNSMDKVEIKDSGDQIIFYGDVNEHVDMKKMSGSLTFTRETFFDFWVGAGEIAKIRCSWGCPDEWKPYINELTDIA